MFTSHIRADNTAVFYYPDMSPGSVHVVGDFNNWQTPGIPLNQIQGGWYGEVGGIPNGSFAYKFIVDGHWLTDPHNVLKWSDGYGTENSILHNRAGKGGVYHFDFYSPSINEQRGYTIYLPPDYFQSDNHFSCLYLLHGALDWEYTWVQRGNINHTMDNLIKEGKVGSYIIVMPRENGEFFKGNGMFADYIYRDLVTHIDLEFKTLAHPKHRAIDGLSTGAFSSMVIGASHPYLFSSVGAMSGAYDTRTFDAVKYNLEGIKRYNLRFHISCGQSDPGCESSSELAQYIQSQGILCEYYSNPGPHDWEFWGPSVAGNLEFHWWSFQK